MAVLFISDLHLEQSRPEIVRQFLDFLEGEAQRASALYILGDLFEAWIGDDGMDAPQAAALAGIRALTSAGVPCYLMQGNRDFLLSHDTCRASGAQLLCDPLIITLYGERVLVMHGDALCSDDHAYQRLRATVRDPDWQRRFLKLPLRARRALSSAARAGSKAHTAGLVAQVTDVNPDSVARALRLSGASTLLHGHTHRPAIHAFELDGRPCTRIVLGDWYEQGSVLRWDRNGPEIHSLERPAAVLIEPKPVSGRRS